MKHLRETFTDQEFADLLKAKKEVGHTWHDAIMLLRVIMLPNLKTYLLCHESDIALSIDDFGELREPFKAIVGREAKSK
jgi:hypothetical protein